MIVILENVVDTHGPMDLILTLMETLPVDDELLLAGFPTSAPTLAKFTVWTNSSRRDESLGKYG